VERIGEALRADEADEIRITVWNVPLIPFDTLPEKDRKLPERQTSVLDVNSELIITTCRP